jgi:hypothetical protein
MIVYYDTGNSNQVMAIYTGDTNSTAWDTAGYTQASVNDVNLQQDILNNGRDCQVTVVADVVTAVTPNTNSSQPGKLLQWKYETITKQGVKTSAIKRYATDNGDGTYSDLVEEMLFTYSGPNITAKEHKVYLDDTSLHKHEKWEYYTSSTFNLIEKKTIG